MSDLNERGQIPAHDPLNYAPRWLREQPEQRSILNGAPRAAREARREPAHALSLDRQIENTISESLRHSLDPEVLPAPPGYAIDTERRSMIRFASRLALAVGVSAVAALFFVIMMARQPNGGSSLVSAFASSMAAVSGGNQADDGSKPALAEFREMLATSGDPSQRATPRQSDQLLRQFLLWRSKANPSDPPQ